MKLARLDNLTKEDGLFKAGESDLHYEYRQIIIVADDYNFAGNNATDISSVTEWINHSNKVGLKALTVEYMGKLISDWATHDTDEKEAFIDFVLYSGETCTLSALQMADIEDKVNINYEVWESGTPDVKKSWDGSAWV